MWKNQRVGCALEVPNLQNVGFEMLVEDFQRNECSLPSSDNLPDLPEPPESPSALSATGSGLPSPPATNSTGSGSTGDNNSNKAGSLRQRPVSLSNMNMPSGNYDKFISSTNSRIPLEEEDDDEDIGNGEDDTARLDLRRSLKTSNENVMALQRVKSLTQRNRMPRHNDNVLSGSETERESQRASNSESLSYSSSDATPPSSISMSRAPSSMRQRRISAPASPGKALASHRQPSPGPSRTPRKRVTTTMSAPDENGELPRDVTGAALAAVASSRRSPSGSSGKRSRQPLPREFRHGDRRSLDGRASVEPSTPHRSHRDSGEYVTSSNVHTSPRFAGSNGNSTTSTSTILQRSPRGPRNNRSSTTRWLSEDLSAQADDDPDHNPPNGYGRRQVQRGGSTDSSLGALNGGRSLVAEGLRAAGIKMKNQPGDDIFGNASGNVADNSATLLRRAKSSAARSSIPGRVGWDDGGEDERSRTSGGSSSRAAEGVGPPLSSRVPTTRMSDPRAHASPAERDNWAGASRTTSRPATSMAELYHGEDGSAVRGGLRSKRSTYTVLDRDRPMTGGSMMDTRSLSQQQASNHPSLTSSAGQDRTYNTLSLSKRHTSMTPLGNGSTSSIGGAQNNSEHTRLMLESLSMFESQLNRLPAMGTTTTVTVPELYRHAETIVHASDKLNNLLRSGTNRALEEQIDAEVGDEVEDGRNQGVDLVEMWRRVGGEYREGLRVSDEIVRTVTGLLLGVGKVLREAASAGGDDGQQHLRSASLGEDSTRRLSPEVTVTSSRKSQDGRRSAESRRSWEPLTNITSAEVSRRLSGRAEGITAARPPSSSRDREREINLNDDLDRAPVRNIPLSATRRLFTPREQREQQMNGNTISSHNTPSDLQDPTNGYEPSPTPASRHPGTSLPGRHRVPPPLAIPPPLPSLPSESLLRHVGSTVADRNNRRKVSTASISTVRGTNSAFFPLTSTNPTTAITAHTVSNSPEESHPPLLRNESHGSIRSSVTFSRPSEVSLSALSGLQQQHNRRDEARKRASSSTSSAAEEDPIPSSAPAASSNQIRSPLSGSETERDTRRRTIGVRSARMSLDSTFEADREDGSGSQAQTITLPSQRRERRRTVTEIFS
ncbi:hypothetical protein SERLA73DRAFT_161294 [Serpula lacrymans var. lacrymans S7.3]|uniref:Uncharacterized protein n=1 Tax=Serpula lacrymans var. lacrymans (strain S7.3) TaxID=936435 RepID=F8Q0E6_SERL3|nr:hypothetical protein SERLA73DRAFT_161294 [Serpula lacrymans var. lacrymans S7.3]